MRKNILISLLSYDKIIEVVKNIKVIDQANIDNFFILFFINPVIFFISVWKHDPYIGFNFV